jgi:hypothetical protein
MIYIQFVASLIPTTFSVHFQLVISNPLLVSYHFWLLGFLYSSFHFKYDFWVWKEIKDDLLVNVVTNNIKAQTEKQNG